MAGNKIKVLIVDDIAETRENIRKLLQFEIDVEVVGAARTGREAISMAKELSPDVILMDINMPDMDGITATEKIRSEISWVQIVILSVQGDPNYMRRAMLAGARDFLTKPPNIDELISAIRRAGKMAVEEREKSRPVYQQPIPGKTSGSLSAAAALGVVDGRVISIYSPKGGVGCTTIAVNLAIILKDSSRSVIVVDGNLQFGNVAIFFNQQGKNHLGDLTPRVDDLDRDVVEEVALTHDDSGVKILPAPHRPELAEDITGDQVAHLLDFLRHIYDYVIVDTTSQLSDVTISILDVSDLIVVITTQDIPAVANTRTFFEVSHALGINPASIIFAMNRYDKRVNITPDRISANLKREFVANIPLDERTVIPSVNRGVPFMLGAKNRVQPAGKALLNLADVIKKLVSKDMN